MAFPPLTNFDNFVASLSMDFPSKSKGDASFHGVAYGYSCIDWDGICVHLRNVQCEDIFKLGTFAAGGELCE